VTDRSAAPRLTALGEAAVLVTWRQAGDPVQAAGRIAALAQALRSAGPQGVLDVVPAPASLLVRFDPRLVARAAVSAAVQEVLAQVPPQASPAASRVRRIRARYGGEEGPDLAEVARRVGLSPRQVVELHTSTTYTVLATGFTPGFLYLGPLPKALVLPRRERPRDAVAPGSVAIAANQAGVYGVRSAGGWWVIGRTATRVFNPRHDPPASLAQGDRLRFVASGGQ
jgi:inhibitor of KinA